MSSRCRVCAAAAASVRVQAHHITHWSEFYSGGHFPALEVPELLAGDLREFFRTLI